MPTSLAVPTLPASAPDGLRGQLAHLFRRAGFGATPAELDRAVSAGWDATVTNLVHSLRQPGPLPPSPALSGQTQADLRAIQGWWLDRMVTTTNPLQEKLTLLWHGHFATGIQKVRSAAAMVGQNQLFRNLGGGSFEALVQAVAKDPAMLVWLDANSNVKAHPNENFARELMELFTLGIGHYSETDVKEAARCFTGWALDRVTETFAFRAALHDSGTKTVLTATGALTGEGVITVLTHTDASARFVAAKLWSHLVRPITPDDPLIAPLADAYRRDLDLAGLVERILRHPDFVGDAARHGLVKQPIEYVAGACRAVGVLPSQHPEVLAALGGLGQIPFDPPSVGGWPQNTYWLSTAATLTRWRLAAALAAKASAPPAVTDLDQLLGVVWSARSRAALDGAPDGRQALARALVAPEYVMN